jgi:DNA-directed RNA polymerase alpha subunit
MSDKEEVLITSVQFTNRWITTRIHNTMSRNGITTFQQLQERTPGELMELESFGATCLAELVAVMAKMGLKLRDPGSW